jgi:hypothetical protein
VQINRSEDLTVRSSEWGVCAEAAGFIEASNGEVEICDSVL